MRYQKLGGTDVEVSALALGGADFARRVDATKVCDLVAAALDAGINFFDTAEAYPGSEEVVAEALAWRRDSVVLATKCGHSIYPDYPADTARGSADNVRRAIEGSLRRLRTDHVDVLYMHQPDPSTPLEETLAVMDDLVSEGKIRFAGGSNYEAAAVAEAADIARNSGFAGFAVHQNSFSLLDTGAEEEVVAACRDAGTGFVAYSPLARGLLSGRYKRGEPIPETSRLAGSPVAPDEDSFDRVEALAAFAGERGLSMAEVAIGGVLATEGVSSIVVGASSIEQLQANARAAEWIPTAEDIAAIREAGR